MRKRTARILRRAADRLDPKPARWYASAWQQGANMNVDTFTTSGSTPIGTHGIAWKITQPQPKPRRRVLADFLSPFDLKKLRP